VKQKELARDECRERERESKTAIERERERKREKERERELIKKTQLCDGARYRSPSPTGYIIKGFQGFLVSILLLADPAAAIAKPEDQIKLMVSDYSLPHFRQCSPHLQLCLLSHLFNPSIKYNSSCWHHG